MPLAASLLAERKVTLFGDEMRKAISACLLCVKVLLFRSPRNREARRQATFASQRDAKTTSRFGLSRPFKMPCSSLQRARVVGDLVGAGHEHRALQDVVDHGASQVPGGRQHRRAVERLVRVAGNFLILKLLISEGT